MEICPKCQKESLVFASNKKRAFCISKKCKFKENLKDIEDYRRKFDSGSKSITEKMNNFIIA